VQHSKDLVEEMNEIVGTQCDVKELFLNNGMKVLVECVFGNNYDLNYQTKFGKITRKIFQNFGVLVLGTKLLGEKLFGQLYPLLREYNALKKDIKEKISEIKRKNVENDDLLSRMVFAQTDTGEKIDDEQILDETITFFVAGHETTSTLLTYIFYFLVKYPEVQEKLRNEVFKELQDRDPDHESIKNIKYLDNVIKESLRFFSASTDAIKKNGTRC